VDYLFSLLNKGRVRKSKRALPQPPGTRERITGVGAKVSVPGDAGGEPGSSKRPALSCTSAEAQVARALETGEKEG